MGAGYDPYGTSYTIAFYLKDSLKQIKFNKIN